MQITKFAIISAQTVHSADSPETVSETIRLAELLYSLGFGSFESRGVTPKWGVERSLFVPLSSDDTNTEEEERQALAVLRWVAHTFKQEAIVTHRGLESTNTATTSSPEVNPYTKLEGFIASDQAPLDGEAPDGYTVIGSGGEVSLYLTLNLEQVALEQAA